MEQRPELLSIALKPGLVKNDQELLNEIISRLKNNPNIIYTIVYDQQQKVRAAFSPAKTASI